MNRFWTTLSVLLTAAVVFAPSNAIASKCDYTTFSCGALSPGTSKTFAGFFSPPWGVTATDIWTFSVTGSGGNSFLEVSNYDVLDPVFDIADLSLTLVRTDGGPDPVNTSSSELAFSGFLSPGDYAFDITGTPEGLFGGIYQGQLVVGLVPEPQVWAMMIAGAVFTGMALRRNQRRRSGVTRPS